MQVAQAGRMMKCPAKVRHAIIDVLTGLAHVCVPNPVDVGWRNQEFIRVPEIPSIYMVIYTLVISTSCCFTYFKDYFKMKVSSYQNLSLGIFDVTKPGCKN